MSLGYLVVYSTQVTSCTVACNCNDCIYIQRLSKYSLQTKQIHKLLSLYISISNYLQTQVKASDTLFFLATTLGVKHNRTIAANIVLGPSNMGTPVINLVKSVVLRVSLLDLASGRAQKDHVDAIATTALATLGNLKVTLPVEGEGVAAVSDGPLDKSTRVVGLFGITGDELL